MTKVKVVSGSIPGAVCTMPFVSGSATSVSSGGDERIEQYRLEKLDRERPRQHIKPASLKDVLGFNPKAGDSAPPMVPPEIVISDHRRGELLAYSKEDVEELRRNKLQEFHQALRDAHASELNKWQKEMREGLDPLGKVVAHRVIQDNADGSSLDEVMGRRRDQSGHFGGGFAYA